MRRRSAASAAAHARTRIIAVAFRRAACFSAFVEQVRTDKGTLNRVRVGPVANRADAENLKAQVAAKVGVAGMVRPHP